MKANDLRTLEVFLAEYSGVGQQPVKPGAAPSGPVASGQQALDTADRAKAERDRKSAGLPKDDVNTDLRAKASAGELSQQPNNTADVEPTSDEKVVNPPQNSGTNISKVQSTGSPTTGKGQNQAVSETDKLKKFKPRGAFGRSAVKTTLKKKLPTGRLLKEADQPEFVVEINFNNKEVVRKALSGPVNCGFEAELIFPGIQSFDDNDDAYGEDDAMIDRINNSEHVYEIRDLYKKTLFDYDNAYGEAFFEYQMEQMSRDFEDEDWVNDFVNYSIDDNDIADYRKETLVTAKEDDPAEYEERLDWEEDAWGRELAELRYQDDMQEYWMENLDDIKLERMVNRFEDNNRHGIDNWLEDMDQSNTQEWQVATEYLQDGDDYQGSSKQDAYEEVEKWLFDWAKMNSHNADIEVGGYHETESHDGWRIEEDQSLDGDGQGFEVISPVFENPKDMLKEIKSLFSYAQDATQTNRSTGLHVTMSYAEESDVPTNIAKTKMYVLSGADNQAKVWNREFNSYSQSTKIQVLRALRAIATGNASEDNIKTMDDMITQFDASGEANKVDRQSTVNVKQRRNSAGNSLVEFRAAGGPGYIDDFEQVAKDAIRYSATIQASYDDDAYNKEFAKKMYKWLQDAQDVEDPQAYSATKGLSPQDVYRQSTGDTTTDVDNHPLTNYMMKFTHSTFQDGVKQALTRFFDSLRHQQEYAQKHNLNEYEENPEEVYADFKSSTREALTDLLVFLSLSANTDKMSTKEVMAIRKLVSQHGLNSEQFIKALKRDTGNPRLIPDPRDKADRTRIFKRGGKLIGKDLMSDAPEKMSISVAPDQVALMTADGLRYIQQYDDTEDAYLPLKKTDYDYIQMEIKALNELFNKSKANPSDTELDVEVRKAAFDLSKTVSTRFNREMDVERIMKRHSDGGLQYALMWQKQLARPHTDPKMAQNLKTLGVEVKPTEEKQAPFESLMSKFEGKSLQEQLIVLEKLDKQKIDETHKKITFRENTVPDNRTVTIVNDLLSEHFPASDLDKQMEAFTAIPMPEMIDRFRSIERTRGPDACCRGVLCQFINYLHPTLKDQINSDFCDGKTSDSEKSQCQPCNEAWQGNAEIKKTGQWAGKTIAELQKLASTLRKKDRRTSTEQSKLKQINFAIRSKRDWKGDTKENISENLEEAKGIMGRVAGDKFVKGNEQLEFQEVKVYPETSNQYQSVEERDLAIKSFEEQAGQIIWTNNPNNGMLAFGVATLTDPLNNNTPAYWGRYFKQRTTNMMGVWQNNQVPSGWKVQKAGALKLDIGIDPQHLIKVETPFASIDQVINTVKKNSQGNPLQEQLISGLQQIKAGQNPVFENCAQHIPALRDYFGEIMGPCALMADMVGGQAEDANQALLKGAGWGNSQVFWPQAMNYALVDSVFIGPDGQEVGISSKGGKGAKASAKNIADAIAKAPPKLVKKYKFTVAIIQLVEQSSAQEGPFRIANYLKVLPAGLEKEIMSYVKSGKSDYVGLSDDAKELFNYGTPKQGAPGFNTGLALTALLAKKVAKIVNEDPTFSAGALSFLNQSSIVQLYCKMGKQGDNARVTGWDAIYPPNFKGRVILDGSKNYYSSRIGGKFAFGFV